MNRIIKSLGRSSYRAIRKANERRPFLTTTKPAFFVIKKHDVILLQDVPNLGVEGQTVSVKHGYSRNYLFPRKIAVRATTENVEKYGQVENPETAVDLKELALQQKRISRLAKKVVTFQRVTSDGKTIKTKVTKDEFINALKKQHQIIATEDDVSFGDTKVELDGEEIFKSIGEHYVDVKRESYSARMKVVVKKR